MRLPGDTRPQPPGGAARVIVRPDAVDENRLALDVPRPQREDLLIRRRVIPGARLRHIGKLDHDDGSRPGTFPRVHLAAVNQKPATEWVHGLLDPLDVGKHLGVDVRGTQMGDGVRAHKSSIDQVSVRPSCYRRRVASITHEVSALGGGDGNAADVAPLERGIAGRLALRSPRSPGPLPYRLAHCLAERTISRSLPSDSRIGPDASFSRISFSRSASPASRARMSDFT